MSGSRFEIEEVPDLDSVWPELVALFLDFEEYNAGFLSRDLRQDWQQRWYESLMRAGDRLLLIARSDERVAGFLLARIVADRGLFDERYAFISDTFVRPEVRGRGIGRRLLRRAEQWCRQKGVSEIRLEAYSANKPAIRFWTLSGFELDSLAMRKSLESKP